MTIQCTSLIALAGLVSAISFTTASQASPRIIIKPTVTGIGFAKFRFVARRRAISAWKSATQRAFGKAYANYTKARSKTMSCTRIGRRNRPLTQRIGPVGTSGNPNSPWVCVTRARPSLTIKLPPPRPLPLASATGIGFAQTEAGAMGLSVRAWTNVVKQRYGTRFANYNKAITKSLRCERVGRNQAANRSALIGVEGNPNAPWTCTAKGRPRRS